MNNLFLKITTIVLTVLIYSFMTSCTKEELATQSQSKELSDLLNITPNLAKTTNKSCDFVPFPADCANVPINCVNPGFESRAAFEAYCAVITAAQVWCPNQNSKSALLALQDAICHMYTVDISPFCYPGEISIGGGGDVEPPNFCQ